ncbi:hypothetical protein SISSUDRAFT_1064083 [Sistotremastrum suecicum HHB10207 ss-3]|uniref:Uncharacterized protein n=1 Tax=Sistotremastrum suecicum HHB10207 ss-3 TaxID=1314776 RepID=A0A166B1R4_9AGAM|nr:hypothetical protein SISSUDRAFT_1064083 [Sistotremastrum suecicum HHB10207 ss-3]
MPLNHYHRPGYGMRLVGLPPAHPLKLWKKIHEESLSASQAAGLQASSRALFKNETDSLEDTPRPWVLLTAREKTKVIEEAMTHIRNNQMYAERYASLCVVTFVASIVPVESRPGVADYVKSKVGTKLEMATILPTSPDDLAVWQNEHIHSMERSFGRFCQEWFESQGIEVSTPVPPPPPPAPIAPHSV